MPSLNRFDPFRALCGRHVLLATLGLVALTSCEGDSLLVAATQPEAENVVPRG